MPPAATTALGAPWQAWTLCRNGRPDGRDAGGTGHYVDIGARPTRPLAQRATTRINGPVELQAGRYRALRWHDRCGPGVAVRPRLLPGSDGAIQLQSGRDGHYVGTTGAATALPCDVGYYQPNTGRARACPPMRALRGHTGAVSQLAVRSATTSPTQGRARVFRRHRLLRRFNWLGQRDGLPAGQTTAATASTSAADCFSAALTPYQTKQAAKALLQGSCRPARMAPTSACTARSARSTAAC